MDQLDLLSIRPGMPASALATLLGRRWQEPDEQGHLTCLSKDISVRLDSDRAVGYVIFACSMPKTALVEGLRTGMAVGDALANNPRLAVLPEAPEEACEGWATYGFITNDGLQVAADVNTRDSTVKSIRLENPNAIYCEPASPIFDPTLTKAFDIALGPQRVLPKVERGSEWGGGWTLGLPPGISKEQWPLSSSNGHPLRHAFTLHLPPEYRTQGEELVALCVFVDDQQEELCYVEEIAEYFTSPLSVTPPADSDLLPFWQHRQARHAQSHTMEDILGTQFCAIWLTQQEFDGELSLPPTPDSDLLDDPPTWIEEDYASYFYEYWLYTRKGDAVIPGAGIGGASSDTVALPISTSIRADDPNVGRSPREWESECAINGYIEAFSERGEELNLSRWDSIAHLGGTMQPQQGYPEFGPYYLEFEEGFGGFNFGGGNAQLDLQQMKIDWACG
ncbi:hypothetical protein [Stenotrophomonas sp.]|uniref:DUF7256 domain-containing protein n=1 Tax=Stenotrophomonas sp. TaxID=69392 RepID=UPI0028A7EAE3|nr:hypothetical protein [Stenotrophomonas sp.]